MIGKKHYKILGILWIVFVIYITVFYNKTENRRNNLSPFNNFLENANTTDVVNPLVPEYLPIDRFSAMQFGKLVHGRQKFSNQTVNLTNTVMKSLFKLCPQNSSKMRVLDVKGLRKKPFL